MVTFSIKKFEPEREYLEVHFYMGNATHVNNISGLKVGDWKSPELVLKAVGEYAEKYYGSDAAIEDKVPKGLAGEFNPRDLG